MNVSQPTFRMALLDAHHDVPKGLLDAKGAPAGNRFSVYRNNVITSLTEALRTAFPLIFKLLGADTFTRMAAVYVRENPPTSPLMMFYGAELPGFLEAFEPLAHIGYLPDCARLDLAFRHSYHAADCDKFDAKILQGDPEDLLYLRMALSPSTIILRSHWPIHDIWRMNFEENAPKPRAGGQNVMVTRPEFDPMPHLLVPGAADWLETLQNGVPFGAAHEQMIEVMPDFDLATALSQALQTGALTEFKTEDN